MPISGARGNAMALEQCLAHGRGMCMEAFCSDHGCRKKTPKSDSVQVTPGQPGDPEPWRALQSPLPVLFPLLP